MAAPSNKRDQIWQRARAEAALAAYADTYRRGGVTRRPLAGLLARAGAGVPASPDAAFDAACAVAAWFTSGAERNEVDWETWLVLKRYLVAILEQHRASPTGSRLALLFRPVALGAAERRRGRGAASRFCASIAEALTELAACEAAPSATPLAAAAEPLPPPPPATGDGWEALRLRGYAFEVLALAEAAACEEAATERPGPEARWQAAAAAAQMSGDLGELFTLYSSERTGAYTARHLAQLFLWASASPSVVMRQRAERLWQAARAKAKAAPAVASSCAVGDVYAAAYANSATPAWLKLLDVLLEARHAEAETAGAELQLLFLAALARLGHRIHYRRVRDAALAGYQAMSLSLSEGLFVDSHAVMSDLLGPAAKAPAPEAPLRLRLERGYGAGSLTWRVVSAVSRAKLARLLRRGTTALSPAETVEITRIIGAGLGQLKGPLMKLGQTASYFGLPLPDGAEAALAALRDAAPPLPFAEIKACIEAELGGPSTAVFAAIEPVPLGVGSIGQAHRARLLNGREVVVKVRIPGIAAAISADLGNLRLLAPLLRWLMPGAKLGELLGELEERLLAECDFRQEAAMQERFRRTFAGRVELVIPRVLAELSTDGLLVTEYEPGLSLEAFRAEATSAARRRAGGAIVHFVVSSCCAGVFQTDNHPGNYRFRLDGTVCCYDFGSVKAWTKPQTQLWVDMIRAAHEQDFRLFRRGALAMGRRRDVKEAAHRRLYDIYCSHSMRAFGDAPGVFRHDVLHREIRGFLNPLGGGFWDMDPDPQFIFGFRVYFGLVALMSELGAEGEWGASLRAILDRR